MTPQQFTQQLAAQTKQLEDYIKSGFPRMARNKVLRSIDNNFRTQGFNGQPWPALKVERKLKYPSGTSVGRRL